jgi:hypothetical protein
VELERDRGERGERERGKVERKRVRERWEERETGG